MKGDKKLKLLAQSVLIVLLTFITVLSALGKSQIEPYREYRFLFGPTDEVKILAEAGVSLDKVFQDIYYRGLESRIPGKLEPITRVAWSAWWSYLFTIWPHEFGHRARAVQVDGDYTLSFGFPIPHLSMEISETEPGEEGLPINGGYEVNSLMRRQICTDFYHKGFGHADELIHSFIQEIFFPAYAFGERLVTSADPEDPEAASVLVKHQCLWLGSIINSRHL